MFRRINLATLNKIRRWEYVVVLDKGDEIIESLKKLVAEYNVHGFFFGIGAVRNPVIAYFDHASKQYVQKTFEGDFEIVSLIGNLGVDDNGSPIVHAHISISDANYNVYGGHLISGEVSVTLELIIIRVEKILRKVNPELNLKLISEAH